MLSEFIIGVGRPVAFYPNLRKLTGSTTATLLLCQFLYWTPRTKNEAGWFYKSSEEIRDETGLTYDEQFTARGRLKVLGLIEERNDRINHQMWFKVNVDKVNSGWENVKDIPEEKHSEKIPTDDSVPVKKKDIVDGFMDFAAGGGVKKANVKTEIESRISIRLHLNPSGKRWEDFIEYAYQRLIKNGETIDKFIDWLITDGEYKSAFASPDRFKMMWPSAFVKEKDDDSKYAIPISKEEENDYVPMPKHIGKINI